MKNVICRILLLSPCYDFSILTHLDIHIIFTENFKWNILLIAGSFLYNFYIEMPIRGTCKQFSVNYAFRVNIYLFRANKKHMWYSIPVYSVMCLIHVSWIYLIFSSCKFLYLGILKYWCDNVTTLYLDVELLKNIFTIAMHFIILVTIYKKSFMFYLICKNLFCRKYFILWALKIWINFSLVLKIYCA